MAIRNITDVVPLPGPRGAKMKCMPDRSLLIDWLGNSDH